MLNPKLIKMLLRLKIHSLPGGYRLARAFTKEMQSVPIEIAGQGRVFVDVSTLDAHAVSLYLDSPLMEVPHETSLTKLFEQLLESTDTVFDIGANLGVHTLAFSKLAKKVIAFEPNPSLVKNLQRTVDEIDKALMMPICLSDEEGIVDFYISDWNHMLSSLTDWSGQPSTKISVPCRTLDSLIADGTLEPPQVIKVDVEGAEMKVFRGASKLLSGDRHPRVIIFEELNIAARTLGIGDGEPAEYLKSLGYDLRLASDDGLTPLPEERPPASNLVALKH